MHIPIDPPTLPKCCLFFSLGWFKIYRYLVHPVVQNNLLNVLVEHFFSDLSGFSERGTLFFNITVIKFFYK